MEKDNRLINIYIKIYNKKNITLDDLRYLAKYDPECFRKTCANVVYNIPESKPVMQPEEPKQPEVSVREAEDVPQDHFNALAVIDNLKQLDTEETVYNNLDAKRVKNLLGNLFMELMFPHNDKETFIYEDVSKDEPTFDTKA